MDQKHVALGHSGLAKDGFKYVEHNDYYRTILWMQRLKKF